MINNSNTHYCDEFVSKCTPFFLQGFDTIYNNTLQRCRKYRFLLKQFQEDLEKIHLWNALIIDNEHKRFMISGNCDWLDNLIKACFLELSEQFIRTHNVSYDLSNVVLPPGNVFIHKCYINIARELWKQPQLLFHDFSAVEKLRNREIFTSIIQRTIIDTFKTNLPMKNMIDTFLDQEGGGCSNAFDVNPTVTTTTETHLANQTNFENESVLKEDTTINENEDEKENENENDENENENNINENNFENENEIEVKKFDDQTIYDEVTPVRELVESDDYEQIISTHVIPPKNELFEIENELKNEQLDEIDSIKSDSGFEQQLNDQDVNNESDQYEANIKNRFNDSYDSISEDIQVKNNENEENLENDTVVDKTIEISDHNEAYYEETDPNMISTDVLPSFNIEKDESMNSELNEQKGGEPENVNNTGENTNEIVLSMNDNETMLQTNNDESNHITEESLFEIKDYIKDTEGLHKGYDNGTQISNIDDSKEIKSINIYDKKLSNREKVLNLLGNDVCYRDFKRHRNKLKKFLLLKT